MCGLKRLLTDQHIKMIHLPLEKCTAPNHSWHTNDHTPPTLATSLPMDLGRFIFLARPFNMMCVSKPETALGANPASPSRLPTPRYHQRGTYFPFRLFTAGNRLAGPRSPCLKGHHSAEPPWSSSTSRSFTSRSRRRRPDRVIATQTEQKSPRKEFGRTHKFRGSCAEGTLEFERNGTAQK